MTSRNQLDAEMRALPITNKISEEALFAYNKQLERSRQALQSYNTAVLKLNNLV